MPLEEQEPGGCELASAEAVVDRSWDALGVLSVVVGEVDGIERYHPLYTISLALFTSVRRSAP